MSMLNCFFGLGKLTFSIKNIATMKKIITNTSFIIILNNVLPKLVLLYLSCIVFELI